MGSAARFAAVAVAGQDALSSEILGIFGKPLFDGDHADRNFRGVLTDAGDAFAPLAWKATAA